MSDFPKAGDAFYLCNDRFDLFAGARRSGQNPGTVDGQMLPRPCAFLLVFCESLNRHRKRSLISPLATSA